MASYWTNKGKADLPAGDITARTLRMLLVNTAPANAAAAADLNVVSDVVSLELSGTGYVGGPGGSGRRTLASVTITEDDTNDWAKLDAADPAVWTAINAGTIAGAWIYRRVGGADADGSDLLWVFIGTTPLVTNGGDVTGILAANGFTTVV